MGEFTEAPWHLDGKIRAMIVSAFYPFDLLRRLSSSGVNERKRKERETKPSGPFMRASVVP